MAKKTSKEFPDLSLFSTKELHIELERRKEAEDIKDEWVTLSGYVELDDPHLYDLLANDADHYFDVPHASPIWYDFERALDEAVGS